MMTKTYQQVLQETGVLCWRIQGVSMEPLIRQGRDTIIVHRRPEERCKKYDIVLFCRHGQEKRDHVLHRILRVNSDGTYWIVGDNCVGGDIVREEDILGVMTSLVRKGKRVDFSRLPYRLYVCLWCAPYRLRFWVLRHIAPRIRRLILRKNGEKTT